MATRHTLRMAGHHSVGDAIYIINLILKISAMSLQCLHLEDKILARINDELQVNYRFYLEIIQSSNGLIKTFTFNTYNNISNDNDF